MAKSTQDRYSGVIKNYLRPQFGNLPLRDITVLTVDRYFSEMGRTKLQYESVDKIRDVLASILTSAVRYGLLVTNPAEGVRLPRARRGKKNKQWITQQQVQSLILRVAEPYASTLYVAAFTGVRRRELIHLRWKDV